ncbi:uncharacterized protein LOC113367740 [Ctenocephalides felis]|uniref:uncharacterized protein LOC113367740 n=1 Tax=Ctenocephalides felis TaxID=7515 RepID=UPI000E6E34A5|nr:uncharacterized protein LOC113367740 [Ctenocephalides felis]
MGTMLSAKCLELRSGSRERSKSSLGFEQINSPQNKQNGNLNAFSRDEDYLRKLSKFNEWRSSQVGLKNDQGDKTPNVRRTSQADFTPQSEPSKQIRYSLDNHHMQYKHLEINDINFSTPQNRSKHAENIYVTDRSQTDPVKKSRELARIDMTFNRSFNKSQRRKSRKDMVNKNILESPTNGDVDDQVPDAFLQRENSLPYQSTEDTYQYVVNKHGDVVEYALPYTERSVDVTKRDLSDIIENESNSDRWSAKENDTYSITDSIDIKTRKNVPNLVSRCGTNAPNDKVGKRLSEVDMKSATSTLEKRRHVNRQSLVDEVQPDDHNQEFLDAIDDLVSLGRWSKRQLEDKDGLGKVRKNCNVPVMLSQLEPIDPSSDFLNCPTIHISCLFIEDKPFLKQRDSILEWRKATWCKEEVFIRSSKPELIHLHRTQTAMARDVHVLR